MDAILGRLDPRQLRQFCVDAVEQELRKAHELLNKALVATKRLEEVQDAARRLRFEVFDDEDALRRELHELHSVHHSVGLSLARIQSAKANDEALHVVSATAREHRPQRGDSPVVIKSELSSRAPPVTGEREFAQAIDLCHESEACDSDSDSDASESDASDSDFSVVSLDEHERHDARASKSASRASDTESEDERPPCSFIPRPLPAPASRKRRLSEVSETPTDPQSCTAAAAVSGRKRELLTELVAKMESAPNESAHRIELLKTAKLVLVYMRKSMKERGDGWEPLSESLKTMLDSVPSRDNGRTDVDDSALVIIVEFGLQVLVKCQPDVRRKKLRQLLQRLMRADKLTGLLSKSVDTLQEYIFQQFIIPKADVVLFRQRLKTARATVATWERSNFTVAEFAEKMDLLRDLTTKRFEAWTPIVEKSVAELITVLLEKVEAFRPGKLQDQRRQTLDEWLVQCNAARRASGMAPVVAPRPVATVATVAAPPPAPAVAAAAAPVKKKKAKKSKSNT